MSYFLYLFFIISLCFILSQYMLSGNSLNSIFSLNEPILGTFFLVLFTWDHAFLITWLIFSWIHSFLNLSYGILSLLGVGVASNLTNLVSSFHVVPNSSKVGIIIAGVLSAIALFVLALFGSLLGYKRISLKKRGTFLSKTIVLIGFQCYFFPML